MERRDCAVVIGAGVAGLATAATLAERFARVVVLDRDELPDAAVPRRGVPQGAHGHILLAAGQHALEQLFPGLTDELVEAGATPLDPGMDLSIYRYGAFFPRVASGLRVASLSRPLLELVLRRRVAATGNVTVRASTAVAALTGDRDRVTGVGLDDGVAEPADLVVDCTGRGSRSDRWLDALGAPVPEVTEVKIGVGQSTAIVAQGSSTLPVGLGVLILPTPPERKVGMLMPIEDGRWLISMGGWHGDFPTGGRDTFLSHARALPDPVIADALADAGPVDEVVSIRFPSSRRRHFERMRRPPAGYLALGDAFCSFNPIYGQGMACAAQQAVELGRLLDRHREVSSAMARDHYRGVNRIVSTPWQFAVGADFLYPQTSGHKAFGTDLVNRYATRIQLASQVSEEIYTTFSAVQQLVMPPSVLWRPTMVARVVRAARRAPGARLQRRP